MESVMTSFSPTNFSLSQFSFCSMLASKLHDKLKFVGQLNSSSRSGQHFNPTMHALFGTIEFRLREELQRIDFVDWIYRPMKILLVTVRHGRIDSHAAFEASVRSGPFLLARRHSFLRLKRLPDASRQRIDDV